MGGKDTTKGMLKIRFEAEKLSGNKILQETQLKHGLFAHHALIPWRIECKFNLCLRNTFHCSKLLLHLAEKLVGHGAVGCG